MLKTIDLFAGAGGLSYGFESTGEFLIVAAAENNKNARKTYIENHTVLDFLDKTQAEKLCESVMAEIKSIAVLEEGSCFRAVNDVTGKPFGSEMTIKNGQVTAVGKTILTKPKNLLGKKEGTKFIISGKQYVIKDIK